MENFNVYKSNINLSSLKTFFKEHGELELFKKKEYFLQQNDKPLYLGYIESGMFRTIRIDSQGNEHIVGYAFQDEYAGSYTSCIQKIPSLVSIQAITDATVYILSFDAVSSFWETDIETQRTGRIIAEKMFAQMYIRSISLQCDTAEQRYISLLQRCPNLPQYITLKEIASYLGVTPETISKIRRKLRHK